MRFGLTARIALAGAVLAGAALGRYVVLTASIHDLTASEQADTRSESLIASASALESRVVDLETGVRGYLLTQRPAFLQPYQAALAAWPAAARQFQRLASGDSVAGRQAASITAAIGSYVRTYTAPTIVLSRTRPVAARAPAAIGRGKGMVDAIRQRFTSLNHYELSLAAARHRAAGRAATLTLELGLAGAALTLFLIVAAMLGLRRTVVVPLRRLAGAVTRVGEGDLTARVPERGAAEVGTLAIGFNAMAGQLKAHRDEVDTQTEELGKQRADLEAQRLELENALDAIELAKASVEARHRFGERLAEQSRVEAVAEVTLNDVGDHAGAEAGAMYVLEEESGLFSLLASRGTGVSGPVTRLSPGQGLAGRALAEKRPIAVVAPPNPLTLLGLAGTREIRAELHLPLIHRGETLGVLSLGRLSEEKFTHSQIADLSDLARRAAVSCAEALERRRSENLAREMRTLMDATDEGILRLDTTGRITFANQAALARTGYTLPELLGADAHAMLHHTRADGTPYPVSECPLRAAATRGQSRRQAGERFWRRDGSSFSADVFISPLFDGDELAGAVETIITGVREEAAAPELSGARR